MPAHITPGGRPLSLLTPSVRTIFSILDDSGLLADAVLCAGAVFGMRTRLTAPETLSGVSGHVRLDYATALDRLGADMADLLNRIAARLGTGHPDLHAPALVLDGRHGSLSATVAIDGVHITTRGPARASARLATVLDSHRRARFGTGALWQIRTLSRGPRLGRHPIRRRLPFESWTVAGAAGAVIPADSPDAALARLDMLHGLPPEARAEMAFLASTVTPAEAGMHAGPLPA